MLLKQQNSAGGILLSKKGEYNAGETVIYCEVDTFLPTSVEKFSFLAPRGTKTRINPDTNQEVEGHTLKTMKLRGVVSQGLILPISDFGLTEDSTQEQVDEVFKKLGVFKYEPPLPAGGAQIGSFPAEARKTDSERVQNLTDEFLQSLNADDWFASEKIDGCLIGNTPIILSNGKSKLIREINQGDYVLGMDENRNRNSQFFRIRNTCS